METRDGLFQLIEGSEGFTCAGAFANCLNIVEDIKRTSPDVILMDIEMPGISGIRILDQVVKGFFKNKIKVSTVFH